MIGRIVVTPKGRRGKDVLISKLLIIVELFQKISLSRFWRTYAILLRSGVPILRSVEIVSKASNNTFIEDACKETTRSISQGDNSRTLWRPCPTSRRW